MRESNTYFKANLAKGSMKENKISVFYFEFRHEIRTNENDMNIFAQNFGTTSFAHLFTKVAVRSLRTIFEDPKCQ